MNDIVIETLDVTEVHTPVALVEAPSLVPGEDTTVGFIQEAPEGEAVI